MRFLPNARLGISLLDKDKPGWRKTVNRETLNQLYTDSCVLFQVYGSFDVGCKRLFGGFNLPAMVAAGFSMADISDGFELTADWKACLK